MHNRTQITAFYTGLFWPKRLLWVISLASSGQKFEKSANYPGFCLCDVSTVELRATKRLDSNVHKRIRGIFADFSNFCPSRAGRVNEPVEGSAHARLLRSQAASPTTNKGLRPSRRRSPSNIPCVAAVRCGSACRPAPLERFGLVVHRDRSGAATHDGGRGRKIGPRCCQ